MEILVNRIHYFSGLLDQSKRGSYWRIGLSFAHVYIGRPAYALTYFFNVSHKASK